jgi:uncharacterized protein (TIGR02300 family)
MPDLGSKHECPNCGIKFYDLGKPEPICPKCGANVKHLAPNEPASASQAARRRRKAELAADDEASETEEPGGDAGEPILDADEDEEIAGEEEADLVDLED